MTDRELLEHILTQINTLANNMESIAKSIDNLINDISDLKAGQLKIEDKINDLESTNADNHIAIKARLERISDDLSFLTHKELQAEKEMYHIKQKLIKRNKSIK